jgi:hypothetical protein
VPLQGRVGPDLIRVTRRQPRSSRNGLEASFSGRIEQAPDGGTLVAGTVGLHPITPVIFGVMSLGGLLILGSTFANGLSSLVSGHPELPELLIPIAFATFYVLILVASPPAARSEIQELLNELNTILDSTATFPAD